MRFAFRIDPMSRGAPYFAICAAIAFSALPASAGAQAARAAQTQSASLVNFIDAAGTAAALNDIPLDDQILSRQRGGALGMLMVAATPQLMRSGGNQVTLWDEIAPPSPLPLPVDAARAAQDNVATYQRK